MDVAVSIIIPIYNSEKFLRRGLDSCVSQTLQNIEIICVNDASKDNSGSVIEEYVKKYPDKVMQINLEKNSGQGGARNQGLLRARGEYVCFMDSDDYLDIHLCEEVYAEAKRKNADMVFYDFIRVDGKREYPVELISEEELELWYAHMGCAPWLQMVRTSIILGDKFFFPFKIVGEDAAILPLWKLHSGKKAKINKPYYYYINRQDSLVNDKNKPLVMTPVTDVAAYRYRMMDKCDLIEKYHAEADLMLARDVVATLLRLLRLYDSVTEDEIKHMRHKLEPFLRRELDERLFRYSLTYAETDMLRTFLYCPENFATKYGSYKSFMDKQLEYGMDCGIDDELKEQIFLIQQKHGNNVAVWGIGEKGLAIVSTLERIKCDYKIFDNFKQGSDVIKGKYVHGFDDLGKEKINIVFVTSDWHYKSIERQIYQKYPNIYVVNIMRMIRVMGGRDIK